MCTCAKKALEEARSYIKEVHFSRFGQMGYHLWNPKSHKIIKSHDVIFNEKKMHKTPIKDAKMSKVTFQDVNPPTHDGKRQVVQAPNVDQMVQPRTHIGSQQRTTMCMHGTWSRTPHAHSP